MKRPDSSDNHSLWVVITRTHYYMHKLREKELKRMGLSIAQSTVLAILNDLNKTALATTPAEISKQLLKAPSTTTELIDRMVDQGLVNKIQDLERKNMVRVEMTERGKELYQKSIEVKHFSGIFAELSPEKHESLKSYLYTLLDATMKELKKRSI